MQIGSRGTSSLPPATAAGERKAKRAIEHPKASTAERRVGCGFDPARSEAAAAAATTAVAARTTASATKAVVGYHCFHCGVDKLMPALAQTRLGINNKSITVRKERFMTFVLSVSVSLFVCMSFHPVFFFFESF